MAVAATSVTVGTAPVLIGNEKTRVRVKNQGGQGINLGGPDVTPFANGFPLAPGAELEFELGRTDFLYAVSSTTAVVTLLTFS